jgi:ELWxxDGT repeat protein
VGIRVFSAHAAIAVVMAAGALLVTVLPVAAARHPGSDPSGMTRVGSQLFFAATTAAHGRELWVTDGTAAGTHEVADINSAPGDDSSWPDQLTAMGSKVFFFAWNDSGCGLWKSNGTADRTKRLSGEILCELEGLMNVGGKLMFRSYTDLWSSNGTVRGTRMIANVGWYPSSPYAVLHGVYYFFGALGDDVTTLWRSDGTAGGTYVVTQMPSDPRSYVPVEMTTAGGLLYFRIGHTYPGGATTDLWQSDGTAAGTRQVRDFLPDETDDVSSPADLRGKVYFGVDYGMPAGDTVERQELWKTDGTESGTRLVKAIGAEHLTKAGSRLFFLGDDGSGMALWQTRGTAGTTAKVAPINFPESSTDYSNGGWYLDPTPVAVGSRLFFPARSEGNGYELWVSDGSPTGTHRVADINPGLPSSRPSDLAAVGDLLYFSADDGVHGRELWVTDGTEAGTHMVFDINPG